MSWNEPGKYDEQIRALDRMAKSLEEEYQRSGAKMDKEQEDENNTDSDSDM